MEDKVKLSLLTRMLNGDFGSKLRTARGRKFKECEQVHWPVPLPPKLHTIVPAAQTGARKRSRKNEKIPLPTLHEPEKKHTLVLGMDNTLVSWRGSQGHKDERLESYYVYLRPNVDRFLSVMHSLFEVVMYTNHFPSAGAALINLLEKSAGLPPSPYYDATVQWGCL